MGRMDAPRCIVCNTRHWSTQPCPAMADVIADERKQLARKTLDSVTKPPPASVPVTNPVTKPLNVTPVTKPKGGRPLLGDKPMTAAERMRKYRQRLKEARP
jgi:hypothetical protein